MLRRKTQTVKGHTLPAPRMTGTGLRLMLQYVALPMMGVLIAADVMLYLFFRFVLGRCYGVLCLF